MSSTVWTVAGLSLDIVGALLLSIEAIKVRNLESAVNLAHAFVFKRVGARVGLSGDSFVTGEFGRWRDQAWLVVGFVGLGAMTVYGSWLLFTELLPLIASVPIWASILLIAAFGFAVLIGLMLAFFVLIVGIALLLLLTQAGVRAVAVIDRRTADGTLGIIGAVLLLVGFAAQIVGAAS